MNVKLQQKYMRIWIQWKIVQRIYFICTFQIYTIYFKTQLKTVIYTVNKVQLNNWKLYFDCISTALWLYLCSRISWQSEKLYFVQWKNVFCHSQIVLFCTVANCIFYVLNIYLQCINISKLSHGWPTLHVQNSIIQRCIFPHTSLN